VLSRNVVRSPLVLADPDSRPELSEWRCGFPGWPWSPCPLGIVERRDDLFPSFLSTALGECRRADQEWPRAQQGKPRVPAPSDCLSLRGRSRPLGGTSALSI